MKDLLKKSKFIVQVYEYCAIKFRRFKRVFQKDCITTYGEKNRQKKFYLIYSENVYAGLYSTIFSILPQIEYARRKKYIPVVDLKHYYLPMMQDEIKKGEENSWEYYYKQPGGITLDEVYQSKNVISMLKLGYEIIVPDWKKMMPANKRVLKYWNNMILQNIVPNDIVQKKINETRQKLFSGKDKILGVGIRAEFRSGMMRKDAVFNNHPKVSSCEDYLDIVEKN